MYYKLKPEARVFFNEHYAGYAKPLSYWQERTIHENLLEKAGRVCVEYGHINGNSTDLSKWNIGSAEFRFTLKVFEMDHKTYDKINIPEIMDEIQKVLSRRF